MKAASNNKTGGKLAPKKSISTKPKVVPVKAINVRNGKKNPPKTTPKTTPKNSPRPTTINKPKPVAVTPTAPKGKLESALETARAVARNKNHFNHNEIKSLLESFEKGWTSKEKFVQLLPGLLGLK